MKITPIKTRKVLANDSLLEIFKESLPPLQEKNIVVVSSKIVSLCEGAIADAQISKAELIKREADAYIFCEQSGIYLTKKEGILIPSAGIDESNTDQAFVLYPRDLLASCNRIGEWLKSYFRVQELGVIIADSHTTPMRRGVLGIGLCWYGFSPLHSYVGSLDCFGRPLQMTQSNLVDALAVAAVVCMGEGNEQTPLALIEDAPKITYHQHLTSQKEYFSLRIDETEDLYGPLLQAVSWDQGKE
ncbi:putative folate metabolism gamma-glutamate ligase [Chlamydia sp.]|uniref:putative folate metabolism gamma-glutamate ligase n=1 Tax=Chlamydia sp. TaxID=35827 RepID=UPI0025C03699|nr:putative folate metabolism gamma-glutamate ligase [Chlamydia sp.]MBQ8498894.1 putative folate metabolism gamma-glutamate ligase [Chlamydia sp.]